MANAFKKFAQKEDISEEVDNFNKAIDKFKDRYAFRPISVYKWNLRDSIKILNDEEYKETCKAIAEFVEL